MFRRDQMLYNEANMQTDIMGNNNIVDNNMDIDVNVNGMLMPGQNQNYPINEAVKERCVHRTFVHEVPQD